MKRSTVIASLGVALFALLVLSSLTLRNSPFLSGSVTTPTYFWTRELDNGNFPELRSYTVAIEVPACALGLTVSDFGNTISVRSVTTLPSGTLKLRFTWNDDDRVPDDCKGTADETTLLYKVDTLLPTLSPVQSEPSSIPPVRLQEYYVAGTASPGKGEGGASPWKRRMVGDRENDPVIKSQTWDGHFPNTQEVVLPDWPTPGKGSKFPAILQASQIIPDPSSSN